MLKPDTKLGCHNNSKDTPINKLKLVDLPSCLHPVWQTNNNNLNNRSIRNRDNPSSLCSLDTVHQVDKRTLSRMEVGWIKCRINFNR